MPSNKIELSLEDGMRIAGDFLYNIAFTMGTTAGRIAGSIRRRRPIVHDVDLVFRYLSDNFGQRMSELKEICYSMPSVEVNKWGPKLAALTYWGVPIDLYFSTPETFHTLLLIRTGSKENNIRLASIAKSKGWKLHASGDGLFNERGKRIAGDSERSIYDALGVPWQEPWERG